MVKSMLEMSNTSENHSNIFFIAGIDTVLIFDRTTWLHDRCYTTLRCDLHTIWKWKKGFTDHHTTSYIKTEILCFYYGLIQSIYT